MEMGTKVLYFGVFRLFRKAIEVPLDENNAALIKVSPEPSREKNEEPYWKKTMGNC